MTTAGIVSVAFLFVLVGLILWGIRGHPRGGDGSGNLYGQGPGNTGTDAGADAGDGLGGDVGGD